MKRNTNCGSINKVNSSPSHCDSPPFIGQLNLALVDIIRMNVIINIAFLSSAPASFFVVSLCGGGYLGVKKNVRCCCCIKELVESTALIGRKRIKLRGRKRPMLFFMLWQGKAMMTEQDRPLVIKFGFSRRTTAGIVMCRPCLAVARRMSSYIRRMFDCRGRNREEEDLRWASGWLSLYRRHYP